MIVNIRITDEALDYLGEYISSPDEATKEEIRDEISDIAQIFINLCEKSATSREEVIDRNKPIGYRLRKAARDLIKYRREAGINGDLEELDRIHELEWAVEEGERGSDRLERAKWLITRFASLRHPDGGISYPTRSMIEEAVAWIKEGEEK